MSVFHYKAIDRTGRSVQGRIEADSTAAATQILAEQGRFGSELTSAEEIEQKSSFSATLSEIKISRRLKLNSKDRCEFISQTATALQAQLPILTALKVVGQQNPRPAIKQLAHELSAIISSGESLSYAMSQYPRTFGQLHLSMVSVGEKSGKLEQTLGHLAELIERELETRTEILTASMYPIFVLCLGLVSVAIVVTWILPQILTTLVVDVGVLPWPTRVILQISDFFRSTYGLLTVGFLLTGLLLLIHAGNTVAGRYFCDSMKLKIPMLRTLTAKWAISRFARTLGTLSNSGVHIIEALQIVRNCLGNEVLAREVERVTRDVRTGSSLAGALRKSGSFPPLLIQTVAVGEETGELAEQLLHAALAFDKDTSVAVKRFMAIFPAILITLLALVIGFIVAATLLPIVQIQTALPGL